MTPGAPGYTDAFVSKLSVDGSTLMYSTYLGGSSDENANQLLGTDYGFGFGGIAVDNSGNAYVTGSTASNDFPTTTGAFQTTRGGSFDAFACKLSTDGKTLDYSTYLGGSDVEYNYDIAIDSSGNAYITGHTESGNFPTSSGAFQTTMAGSEDAFISKISADGTSLVYSIYLGGSSGEYGLDIAVNSSGNAYLTGSTVSSDFPLANSIQENRGGGVDAFVSKLSADGTSLAYSTFLGGLNLDQGKGIVIDDSGNAYVTGKTASYDFPRVAGSYDVTFNRGVNDAFIAKLSDDVVPPPATLPTVTTQAVTGIGTTSATGNGNITDLGSPNPTQHGLCWNTTGTPTTADSATTEGAASATGAFASNITGLSPGITYYVRAYATNTEGTAYGSVVSFTTSAVQPPPVNAPPTVTTQAVTGIGTNLATGHGNITDLGSPDPSQYGVCWNTTGTPTIADSNTTQGAANATGAFTSNITGLSPNTTYYVRAYAINTEGTAYGNQVSFTTAAYMAAPVSVPTMNEWGMILFSLLIAGVFLWFIRRQNKKSC